MSRVPWHLFQNRQPRVHLVVGALGEAATDGDELTATLYVLMRVIRQQKPAGDYAATVVRDAGRPEIYLAFEDEGDARKFAAAVKPEAIGSHPGWASQRAFELDSARLAEIEASLPPPKTHVRQGQSDQSSLAQRSRRGPWIRVRRDD
jgi:hypothetical protein